MRLAVFTSRLLPCAALLAATLLPATPAAAQSLGCNGYLVGVGDSRVSVLQKCGEPMDREAICVQRLQQGWIVSPNHRGGGPTTILAPQCVPMEDWTYYRGPGSFLGIVRLYNGAVESVRDGERMR